MGRQNIFSRIECTSSACCYFKINSSTVNALLAFRLNVALVIWKSVHKSLKMTEKMMAIVALNQKYPFLSAPPRNVDAK